MKKAQIHRQNREKHKNILTPYQEKINSFEKKVEDSQKEVWAKCIRPQGTIANLQTQNPKNKRKKQKT